MSERRYGFLDVETTGLLPFHHDLVEIGLLITNQELNTIAEWAVKVQPEAGEWQERASDIALELNGYDPAVWAADGVRLREGMHQLIRFKRAYISPTTDFRLVSQNNTFDFGFLLAGFHLAGVPMDAFKHKYWMDTMTLGDALGFGRVGLSAMAKKFGLEPEPEVHRALNGARLCREVFRKLKAGITWNECKDQLELFSPDTEREAA